MVESRSLLQSLVLLALIFSSDASPHSGVHCRRVSSDSRKDVRFPRQYAPGDSDRMGEIPKLPGYRFHQHICHSNRLCLRIVRIAISISLFRISSSARHHADLNPSYCHTGQRRIDIKQSFQHKPAALESSIVCQGLSQIPAPMIIILCSLSSPRIFPISNVNTSHCIHTPAARNRRNYSNPDESGKR